MLNVILTPSAPGVYSEWPTLVGAPTAWEAARAHDAAYLQSTAAGQRVSFPVALPEIRSDDTLVSLFMRAYLARPSINLLLDNGFEAGTLWAPDDNGCIVDGSSFDTSQPHSGLRCLRFNSRSIGPTCAGAEITLGLAGGVMSEDLIPGVTYGINLWHDSIGGAALPRRTSVRVDAIERGAMTANSVQNQWARVGFGFGAGGATLPGTWTWVAAAPTQLLRLDQPSGVGTTLFSRFLDDLLIEKAEAAVVTPFYRLYGQDHDLDPWIIAPGQEVQTLQADRAIEMYGHQLRDGGFELGVRSENLIAVQLDQLQLAMTLRHRFEGQGFVGSRYS